MEKMPLDEQPLEQKKSPLFSGAVNAAIGAALYFGPLAVCEQISYKKGQGIKLHNLPEGWIGRKMPMGIAFSTVMGLLGYLGTKFENFENIVWDKNRTINLLQRVIDEKNALMTEAKSRS